MKLGYALVDAITFTLTNMEVNMWHYEVSLLCKKCAKSDLSCRCTLHPITIHRRQQARKKMVKAYYVDRQENWNIV